jgi:hypothetical protein
MHRARIAFGQRLMSVVHPLPVLSPHPQHSYATPCWRARGGMHVSLLVVSRWERAVTLGPEPGSYPGGQAAVRMVGSQNKHVLCLPTTSSRPQQTAIVTGGGGALPILLPPHQPLKHPPPPHMHITLPLTRMRHQVPTYTLHAAPLAGPHVHTLHATSGPHVHTLHATSGPHIHSASDPTGRSPRTHCTRGRDCPRASLAARQSCAENRSHPTRPRWPPQQPKMLAAAQTARWRTRCWGGRGNHNTQVPHTVNARQRTRAGLQCSTLLAQNQHHPGVCVACVCVCVGGGGGGAQWQWAAWRRLMHIQALQLGQLAQRVRH